MPGEGELEPTPAVRGKRADATRNQAKLLAAAADVFAQAGVDAPIRRIATAAGVGLGTIYRHFPTRADLVIAVFQHQVEECAEAGPRLLGESASPLAALRAWLDLFADFLVTKHGLATTLGPGDSGFQSLHAYFLDRLQPVARELIEASITAGEIGPIEPYALMRGIGNLYLGAGDDPRYEPRLLVDLLLEGLRRRGDDKPVSPACARERNSDARPA
ncbi:TetR/AcrR family transcriptional regulator [Streptacidiphilus jiangxiensis]|uniref:DNA-binding transcriptional regulator, AcrR family n=1 Tax=Streptacidiphilus jiangxiensis TaxID=235985 RepID=A0A1H7P7J7_STRJI|nr:TetR/AcrR family transcriptional regulator [Streptacidiphilus jiangxiensis]SEL31732.1 DNA-binding transcriptional regulator, AcrR family [Streptacidiphilus jiangxiensis]